MFWITWFTLVLTLFSVGCAKKVETPAPTPATTMPAMNMPMMKEDPRSIMSVEGTIKEVSLDQIVVFTQKQVSLKFKIDSDTVIKPKHKLVPGMQVKVEIQHLPYGMKAKTIELQLSKDANHCC